MRNRFIVVLAVIAGVHLVGGTFLFVADRWQRPGPAPGAITAEGIPRPPTTAPVTPAARPALVNPVVAPGTPAPGAAGEAGVHVVGKGDSYWTIAKRYGVSVSALQSANGFSASHVLKAGERVKIPAKTPPG